MALQGKENGGLHRGKETVKYNFLVVMARNLRILN